MTIIANSCVCCILGHGYLDVGVYGADGKPVRLMISQVFLGVMSVLHLLVSQFLCKKVLQKGRKQGGLALRQSR